VSEKIILKLQLPTDPLWVKNVVESNIEELLTDHAFCEQKAASNAITLIVQNPNLSDLVQEMTQLVQEEMDHFKRVHDIILARGFVLGRERKDNYVNELMVSEAAHYSMFIRLAKKYAGHIDVDRRWKQYLAYEAEVVQNYGKSETIHG
jgi:tRNA-(ms[2]io[6]A)-hydroxylase